MATPRRRHEYEHVLEKYVKARAHDLGVSLKDIKGPRRHKPLVAFRRDIARRAHQAGFYLAEIGRVLNRDHTTIRHLIMNNGHGEG